MNNEEQNVFDNQNIQKNKIEQEQQKETTFKKTNDINLNNECNNLSQEDIINQEQSIEETVEKTDFVNSQNEHISKLETLLLQAQQRERDNMLSARAEMENIRRRSEQNIEKAYKFALEHFFKELLPVIDNLERALNISNEPNIELIPLIEGIKLTLKSLLDTVHKFGLSIIKDVYVPFNPEIHQAITMIESEEHEPNKVIEIIQKGYLLNGRLIRPAMVTVSKMKN